MIRLVCIAEIEDATTIEDAQAKLDAFREAVLPSQEYGLTLYRATEGAADAAYYADSVDTEEPRIVTNADGDGIPRCSVCWSALEPGDVCPEHGALSPTGMQEG